MIIHMKKTQICHVDMKVCYLRNIIFRVINFLVEMTNFHVILTEECCDAPLITDLFLLCSSCHHKNKV